MNISNKGIIKLNSISENMSHDNLGFEPTEGRNADLPDGSYKYNTHEKSNQNWFHKFCIRCHPADLTPSWEPPFWPKFCPHPICPTYRHFSSIITLIIIGVLTWTIVYLIMGNTASPGGALFGLVSLVVASHICGWLVTLAGLPALIGMLVMGILFQNVGLVNLEGEMSGLISKLRKFALVIILARAGLGMDPVAFKKLYRSILTLGLVPWAVEWLVVTLLGHYLLNMPWMWSLLLGAVIAAVSPAVIVPCLFRLRAKGYGVSKGIPTLIVAAAGIDDATSVAVFGIMSSIMFSSDSLGFQIAQVPVSFIGGVGFGILWGILAKYMPEKNDPFVVTLRTLMLLSGGIIAVLGSSALGFEGAGPLAVVTAAFVSSYFWCEQGWKIENNPVVNNFAILWIFFEPILFGTAGAQVKISELDPQILTVGLGCLCIGVLIRLASTYLVIIREALNFKEKIFVALSWMAKATVQAALGPVALNSLADDASDSDRHYGDIVLTICVLSIIVTAPLGAIIISLAGPRLLTNEVSTNRNRLSLHDVSLGPANNKHRNDDAERQ